MTDYHMNSAEQLYNALPQIYRTKDSDPNLPPAERGHLKMYLEALGDVLDLTRHTLIQRYNDSFPDNLDGQTKGQDWLIPYFAELFAVSLQSPSAEGQRAEVGSAVRWAQRKGTLGTTEEIVEAITQSEAVIHEGWKKVARTARMDMPLLPAQALGETPPQLIARHPGLPTVTPYVPLHARAIQTQAGTPMSQRWSSHAAVQNWPVDQRDGNSPLSSSNIVHWRHANPQGAPCFPNSYQDMSKRTPDFRGEKSLSGGCHPKVIAIYLPAPSGLCPDAPLQHIYGGDFISPHIVKTVRDDGTTIYRNVTAGSLEVVGTVTLSGPETIIFEKIRFKDEVVLEGGPVIFEYCAIAKVSVATPPPVSPLISMTHCLAGTIAAPGYTVMCEYVTVLEKFTAERLLASDCIFPDDMDSDSGGDCVRYSRVSKNYLNSRPPNARTRDITIAQVDFENDSFDTPGAGVLALTSAKSILFGAEDGGEMGAYHNWGYTAHWAALKRKLTDYLPIGITPVIIRDPILACPPPKEDI